MFDIFLGGKFSKKCKHCVKCINSRTVLIRKKRQATVRFLKEDVADLLASEHDLNAFGRIEALIVEINHMSCYDMIERYCQCILNQLPSLQKQRECPEEAMEAISTLIFAAARFSDLPELYDLRRVFTERYGSHMESSVNAEFVEKIQKKSFTMERKMRLMKDIAEEFSVRWDSKAFQQKLSNTLAPSDQPKISKNTELRSHSAVNGRNAAVNQQKETIYDATGEVNGRNGAVLKAGGSFNSRKEAVFDDDRKRAALNVGGAANNRREELFRADVAVNGRNEAVFGRDSRVLNMDGGSFNRRKEEVFIAVNGTRKTVIDSDVAANKRNEATFSTNGTRKTVIDSDVAANKRNEATFSTNADQEVQYKERWEPPLRCSVQKQQVHSEPKDIHVIPIIRNGQSHDPSEMTQKFYTASKETENAEPVYDNAAVCAYGKDTGSQNGIVKDGWLKSKVNQNEGITRSRSPIAQDGPGLIGFERQHVGSVISRDVKAVNMIPPYNKFKGSRNEGGYIDSVPIYDELPKSEEGLDSALQPVNSKNARPMSMIPPYTKPNFKNPLADADDTKLAGTPINISSAADYERSNGGEKANPVSVRRRLPKPPPVIEANNAIDDTKPVIKMEKDRYAEETVHRPQGKVREEIHGAFNHDRTVHGTSSGRRKHGGWRSNAMYDGDCDEEEEVVDRLLLHLSKKGINNDNAKRRTRTRASHAELVSDASRDGEQYGNGRSHYRPQRVASLPPEPKSPIVEAGIGRGPFRATSMQPDMLSHNGANLRIPDYDDLYARFHALKRT